MIQQAGVAILINADTDTAFMLGRPMLATLP
jgi:hypothetical protein